MAGPVERRILGMITGLSFLSGMFLGVLGVVLLIVGDGGDSEMNIFGATIKTGSIGIAAIFIGAMLIILNTRAILKSLVVVQDADHIKPESPIANTRLYKYVERLYNEDLEKERRRDSAL